ncbi:hypothetical protein BCR43DRAFT_493873 [Syncephalastrum racemosum]|uniref:Transmembrane protein n=1 Tax=Syncephalastrum racemosum TaxID=13706 RepID=A0A1X2HBC5_SYNRA|nr:hypothetical protein BCR43DRAFT_493873 [Syncephalastrum racemosum]
MEAPESLGRNGERAGIEGDFADRVALEFELMEYFFNSLPVLLPSFDERDGAKHSKSSSSSSSSSSSLLSSLLLSSITSFVGAVLFVIVVPWKGRRIVVG